MSAASSGSSRQQHIVELRHALAPDRLEVVEDLAYLTTEIVSQTAG
jgi:hypothetical protein